MSEKNAAKAETGTNTEEMGEKLKKAGKKAEAQKAEKRERTVKGSHLLGELLSPSRLKGFVVEEKSGFTKILGKQKGRAIYVAKKGGRADMSGFTLDHAGLSQISEEEARTKHLGKVRAQLNFDQADEVVLQAYDAALTVLAEEPPASETPAK